MTTQTGYYVTVIRDSKVGWLFGPCADHGIALLMVEPIRKIACVVDPFCDFDLFGTSHITVTADGKLPIGKLNAHFDKYQG